MSKQRGSKHLTNRLSAQFVRTAPPGFYCDGQGLNLRVDPSGARRWVQRLVIRGKPRTLGLGGYPLVSLKEAREKALANRKMARAGGDPLAEKRRAQGIPDFAEAATKVIELHRPSGVALGAQPNGRPPSVTTSSPRSAPDRSTRSLLLT